MVKYNVIFVPVHIHVLLHINYVCVYSHYRYTVKISRLLEYVVAIDTVLL